MILKYIIIVRYNYLNFEIKITIAIVRSKWTLRFGDSSSTYKAFSSDCGLYAVDMSADKMKYFTVKDAAPLKQSGYLIGKLLLD